jgi:alkylation response protein AidB-like acyl-CoA dehydrogenase
MDFTYSEEQTLLKDSLAGFLRDRYGWEARRDAAAGESGWRPEIWKAFADELGLLGAPFPETLGGFGGGAVETQLIMEAFGEHLVVEPYLGTVVIGGGLLELAGHPLAEDLIAGVIAGETRFAFAWAEPQGRYDLFDLTTTARRDGTGWRLSGGKAVVVGAPWATHLIVTARTAGGRRDREGVSVFLVGADAAGVSRRDYATIDGGRASEIAFDAVSLPAEALIGEADAALPLVEEIVDRAIAAICAEGVGVVRRLQAGAVDYAKQRRQFGRAIGEFQVLQHRLVDMFMEVELAASMSLLATLKLGAGPEERVRAASAAKVQIAKACRFVGQGAIQIHGGIGMTQELPIGAWFKRATLIESAFGGIDHHLARFQAAPRESDRD